MKAQKYLLYNKIGHVPFKYPEMREKMMVIDMRNRSELKPHEKPRGMHHNGFMVCFVRDTQCAFYTYPTFFLTLVQMVVLHRKHSQTPQSIGLFFLVSQHVIAAFYISMYSLLYTRLDRLHDASSSTNLS
jgi:uncharacterized MAPEG superfamily protein